MFFGPLGGADEAVLFGVPACQDDGALRRPAALDRRTERTRHFELRRRSGVRIDRAMRPGVAMVAENHQLVGLDAALDGRDDVVDRLEAFVHLHVHRDARGARTDVIRKRQSALPVVRHARAAETPQDLLRFGIRDRQRGNLRNVGHLRRAGTRFAPLVDGQPGVDRIAGHVREEQHRSALNRRRRAHRPVGIHIARHVAVVARIGVDEHADGAAILRLLDLQPAERAAVANQRDLAFDRDAHARQAREVGRRAVVHVDDLALGAARRAVAVERREHAFDGRVLVDVVRVLAQLQLLFNRRRQLERDCFG